MRFNVRSLTLGRIAGLMGLGGIALCVIVSLGLSKVEYDRRMAAARADTETEAFFLADHAGRLFETAQAALETGAALTAGQSWDALAASEPLHRQLRALATAMAYVEDLWFNDETGRLRATSFAFPAPVSDAHDRDNFIAARRPGKTLFIGPRIVGRVTGRPTFLISRRLEDETGRFSGMVSATADLHYFLDYWQRVKLPYDSRVTLFRPDGVTVLAQYPDGANSLQPPPLDPPAPGISAATYQEGEDGRFGAFRQVADQPLFVAIDISTAKVRAAWWVWVRAYILPFLAISTASLGVLTALAFRQARAESRGRRALHEANEALTTEMESRRTAEEQVRQMQKMEAIGQLTGGIAHDFNNMLAIVMGSLSLMQRRLQKGDHNVERYLHSAMEGARRAATLTQRLLAFARRQPLTPQVIDARVFVADLAELLRRTLPEIVEVRTRLAPAPWPVHADPHQLESVILNLAVNARDAMPAGGVLTIGVDNVTLDSAFVAAHPDATPGDYVAIAVADGGSGMTPEVRGKAFEPFFTTKAVGAGTGLGLSQVYGFVRQSGGFVALDTAPGAGTTVTIHLPRHRGGDTAPPARPGKPGAGSAHAGRPEETVLVVEDEDSVRLVAVEALRELGYTVIHASGGRAALAQLETHPEVRLLLTDVMMPEMSGRELGSEARRRYPDLRIVYSTGYSPDIAPGSTEGLRLVRKPFSMEELGRAVREALDA